MTATIRKLARFLPALCWAGLIFWASAQSKLPQPPVRFEGLDKLVHAAVFAVLALMLLWADGRPRGWRAWLWALVTVLYGLTDELHQSFVPLRQPDVFDLLADAAGALGVVGLWLRFGSASGVTRQESLS